MAAPKVAVVGAGVVGLSTALCIMETCPSCSVTILSEQFSPNTTSDVAAGMLIPHTYPDTPIHVQKQWFRETFTYLFAISNSAEASEAGIHLVSGWQVFKNTPKEELPFWSDVVLGFRPMSKAELQKFPQHQSGQAFTTLKCDCPPYLLWLEKRLKATGVQMYTRKVADLWELHNKYDIIVNCAGIGAHQLVGDKKLFPIRGQVLKVHAPWVKNFIRDGDGLTYIYPGIHRITLGGTREKDNWSLSPDPGTTKDIFDRCCSLEPSLQGAQDIQVKEKKIQAVLDSSAQGQLLQKAMLVHSDQASVISRAAPQILLTDTDDFFPPKSSIDMAYVRQRGFIRVVLGVQACLVYFALALAAFLATAGMNEPEANQQGS